MTLNEFSVDESYQIQCLIDQGFSSGLARSLIVHGKESFPLRIWVLDNSGSMNTADGQRLVETNRRNDVRWTPCTRWAELRECVNYHAQLAALLEAPTQFKLLNPSFPNNLGVAEMGSDMIEEELASLTNVMDQTPPSGATPLTSRLHEIYDSLVPVAPSLRAEGKQVVVCLATDGVPTNERGVGGPAVQRAFETALRRLLQDLPVWMVVRLCTDEAGVVNYYEGLDQELETNLEVLDDFETEAKQVHQLNPWLTYGLPLHRCREAGFRHKIFDLLDERKLTLDEVAAFCRLLFFSGETTVLADPHADWQGFVQQLQRALQRETDQYNPVKRRVTPWIQLHILERQYGPYRIQIPEWFVVSLLVVLFALLSHYIASEL